MMLEDLKFYVGTVLDNPTRAPSALASSPTSVAQASR